MALGAYYLNLILETFSLKLSFESQPHIRKTRTVA